MSRKKNQQLRPERDLIRRKKVNDSTGWTKQMLELLSNEEEPDEKPADKRKKKTSKGSMARRLTGDSL